MECIDYSDITRTLIFLEAISLLILGLFLIGIRNMVGWGIVCVLVSVAIMAYDIALICRGTAIIPYIGVL